MKKNKLTIIILAILILLTVSFAVIHLTTRTADENGILKIEYNDTTIDLAIVDFRMTSVIGTTVNGSGETKEIDSKGILLKEVLENANITVSDFSEAKIIASDEYSAVVYASEITDDNVYLITTADNTLRLIIFGDENSKRDVKNVVRIDIK